MKNLVIFLVLAVTASAVWAEDPVYFADENLKAVVESELGITDPTPTDVKGLYFLHASEAGIENLTGLEHASSLRMVIMNNNNISDISPLSSLVNLETLILYHNNISNVSPLSNLTTLYHLALSDNDISDVSGLAPLTNLTMLYLMNNNISDISPLAGLTKLPILYFYGNNVSDLSALSEFTHLSHADFRYNKISNIPNLSTLASLGSLQLSGNIITDVSGLSTMTNLDSVNLSENNIVDIPDLSTMTNLVYLNLNGNNITDISGVSTATNLVSLYLGGNNITDISALSALTNLGGLDLTGNNVSDISSLSQLTNLWHGRGGGLYLNDNPLDCLAYDIYIPMIQANNPGVPISYDPMPPECENEPPVADAGEDDRVAIGDTVWLDGSGSYDPDADPLTYLWSFVSIPLGSGAMIDDPTAVRTLFMPDLFGDYVVSLVVNDGTVDSHPDTVTITAIPPDQAAAETLVEMEEIIQLIPPEGLHNDNAATPLTKKIEATLTNIANGSYQDALTKLQDDILKKTDGCALTGAPDSTDWLLKCEDQADVYPLVMRAIELLESLIQ